MVCLFPPCFTSRHAQKSPPHITLQPPFRWVNADVPRLEAFLQEFAHQKQSLLITLNGFNAFPPRVIYIDVVRSQELLQLQAHLMAQIEAKLGIIDKVGRKRPFTPHVTVAFRDMSRQNFKAAWPEFAHRQVDFEFMADRLTLLIHDGRCWQLKSEFGLQDENQDSLIQKS